MRTPHWHANATELTYCVSGTALVSILDDGEHVLDVRHHRRPDVPRRLRLLHHIENVGLDVAEFIIAFRNERPEDFGFGATLGAFSDAVLGNTYDLPACRDGHRRRSGAPPPTASSPPCRRIRCCPAALRAVNNPHKFGIEAQQPGASNYVGGNALRP